MQCCLGGSMEIKVSVIIPIYNAAPWISECICSVLTQDMDSIEIICVDDGSSDESIHIIKELAKNKSLTIIENEHAGAGYARNIGICHANGEYVMFLDADDYFPNNNVLNRLYTHAIKSHLNICGGSAALLDGNSVISSSKYKFQSETILDFKDTQFIYGFWRFLFKRDYLIENRIFFPTYSVFEDPVFLLKAFSDSELFAVIPDVVYVHRKNHKARATVYEKMVDQLAAYDEIIYISTQKGYSMITHEMEEKKKKLSRWMQNYHTNAFYQTENRYKVKSSFVWIADIIERNHAVQKEMSLCDVGCAAGDFLKYMYERFYIEKLVGIDCNENVLELANKNCPMSRLICADISEEEFEKKYEKVLYDKYDLVTLMGTLYLFDDFRLPVKNLLSLVKDDGVAFIFGSFNQYGIDVSYKYRFSKDGKIYSCEDFSHSIASVTNWAEENGCSVKCYEFSLPVEIERTDDPLRVWTHTLENGHYLQRDGLNRVKEQFLLEIRKKQHE